MKSDLKNQVHGYGTQLTDDQVPITGTEVLGLLESVRELDSIPVRPRRTPSLLAVAAVAACLVLLIAAIPVVAGFWAGSSPPANQVPDVTTTTAPDAEALARAAGLPPGWIIVELELGRDVGQYRLMYAGSGLPWVLTMGAHCIDEQGVARVNDVGEHNNGPSCTGDVVSAPQADYFGARPDGSWEALRDLFPGSMAHLNAGFTNIPAMVVCPGGSPINPQHPDDEPLREALCAHQVSDDARTWFTPTTDDGSPALRHPSWRGIDGRILSLSQPEYGVKRWYHSSDGGRSFRTIATEDVVEVIPFTYEGRFRSIIWADGDAILRELSDDLEWQPIGTVTGIHRSWYQPVVEMASGNLLMLNGGQYDEYDGRPIGRSSDDGGVTWTTIEPDVDVPFDRADPIYDKPESDRYWVEPALWVREIAGWLLLSTDRGLYLTDGEEWYPLADTAVAFDRNGSTQRDPITIRLPAYTGP